MANEVVNRTVNIFIQSGDAQKAYDKLIAKQKDLNDQLAKNPKNAEELRKKLAALEEPISRAAKKLSGELEPSLKDTQSTATKLRNELSRMSESDPGFRDRVKLYAQANKELEQQRGRVGLLSQAWKSFWQEAKTVAVGVLVGNTLQTALQTAVGYVSGIVTGSAKIADELSDIEKTTGLTKEQVKQVNSELSKIDTRTSTSQLRELAAEAGKLGKESVEDVIRFVKEADQIRVALGEDLGEDAIISIGKLSKIFKQEMLNIGSAINEIGANSEASERFAVDFLNRLAGTGPAVKLSAADLLGYGAALEIAGQTAEVSGTALSNFFIDFVRDSEKFGKAAGFANGELTKLINEKGTNAAFIEFLTRLKQANPDAQEFLKRMQELGIDGSRGANVMLALSNNIGEVRKQQLIANDAMAAGTSLTDEFNKKNNNAAGELDKLKKNFASLFTSSTFREGGEAAIRTLNSLVNVVKSSFKFFSDHKVLIGSLTAIYIAVSAAINGTTVASVKNTVVTRLKNTLDALELGITRARTAALIIYGNIVNLVTGRITAAAFAQRVWNTVMALGAGPIGVLLVVVGAAAVAIQKLTSRQKELTSAQKLSVDVAERVAQTTGDTVARVKLLEGVLKDENAAYAQKKRALDELIKINPDFANTLKLNKDGTVEGTEAIADYIKALTAQAEAQVKYELFVEKTRQRAALIGKVRANVPGLELFTDEELVKKFKENFNSLPSLVKSAPEIQTFVTLTGEIDALSSNMALLHQQAIDAGKGLGDGLGGGAEDAEGKLQKLRKQLADLEAQREKEKDDKTIASLSRQIEATQEQIDKLLGKKSTGGRGQNQTENDVKQLREELEKLATSLLPEDTIRDRFQKELQALDNKYANFREKAHGNNELLLQIENLYQIERAKLIDKFRKEDEKNFQDALKARKDHEAEEARKRQEFFNSIQPLLDRTIQRNLDQLSRIDRDQDAKRELEVIKSRGKKKLEAELSVLDAQQRKELEKKDLTENEKLLIEEKFRQKRLEAENSYWNSLLNNIANWAQSGANIVNLFDQIRTNKENAALDRDRAVNEKKKQNLDKRLKQGLISQQQYDKEVERLQKQQEAKEKAAKLKQFKRDQRASIVQATIDGLRAVSKTLAEFGPPVPPNFLGIAAMAATVLTTGLQIKAIASKEPPAFARGGKLNGRSHHQGGMGVYDHFGRKQAEVEGDEGIINKFSMRDRTRYTVSGTPSQIASALNARHGGVHWERGAMLAPVWKTNRPQPMNFAVIRQAQHYAAGGQFQKPTTSGSAEVNDQLTPVLMGLMASVNNLNEQLAAGITAKTFITDQEAQQDRLNKIREDSTFKA